MGALRPRATWGLGKTSLCVVRAEVTWVCEKVKGAPEDSNLGASFSFLGRQITLVSLQMR